LKQLCSYKGVEINEGHIMPDHVHMLVSILPKMRVSSFMGYLKGKSARMTFGRHADLKYKFGNRHFWSEGYYVSTVGLNEATIKKYIQDQEKFPFGQRLCSLWPLRTALTPGRWRNLHVFESRHHYGGTFDWYYYIPVFRWQCEN